MRRFLIICVMLTAIAAPANAQFSFLGIKNSLVDFVLDQISVPGELVVSAEAVEDGVEGSTDIVGLTVADGKGVWLSIERISLQWNSSRVLRGELEINRLAAIGVNVVRPPVSSAVAVEVREDAAIAETDDDPFDWPRAPITVRVEDMALTDVVIAPGVVAAQGIAFDANGAVKDEGDEQSLNLSIIRTDDVAGQIILKFLRDFSAENRLDLSLEANEAPGGIVAALADLPPESATKVSLRGEGPLTEWALDFDALVDDVIAANGTARISANGPLAATADFTLVPGATLDPAIVRALSPAARLQVDIAEGDGGIVRIHKGSVTARDLTLAATGTYDKPNAIADLNVLLDGRAGLAELVEGVTFAGFGFDGALKGPLNSLSADGQLYLNDLKTAAADIGSADLRANVQVSGEVIALDIGGGAKGVRLDRLGPDLLGVGNIEVKGTYAGDKATLAVLRFDARPLSLSASGEMALGDAPSVEFAYELATPELAPLAEAYDVKASGRFSAKGDAVGPLDAIRISGALSAEALTFDGEAYGRVDFVHDVLVDDTPGGAVKLTADGSRFGLVGFDGGFELVEQTLHLTDLAASGLGARIGGDLRVDLETSLIEGTVDLAAPDLTPFTVITGEPINGAVDGQVLLAGKTGKQSVNADLNIAGFKGFSAELRQAKLTTVVSDALGAADVSLTLNAAGLAGGGAQIGSMTATGDIRGAATDSPQFDLGVKAQGTNLGGARVAHARANVKGGLADLTADAVMEAITAPGAKVAKITATARVKEALGADANIATRVMVFGTDLGVLNLPELVATADGRLSALKLGVDTAGALADGREITAKLRAVADVAGAAPQAEITTFSADLQDETFALRQPLAVKSASGVTSLRSLDFAFPGGALTGDVTVYGAGIAGDLQLKADDLGRLAKAAGAPLEQGALDASAVFDTRKGRAKADVSVAGRDLRFADVVADIGALALDATVAWDGAFAQIDAALSGPFAQPFRAAIRAPLRASASALPVAPPDGPLSGTVDWVGDIGEVWVLVPAPGHVLDGETRIALSLGGTVASPTVGGDVALKGGRYENLDVGTILTDLQVTSQVASDGAFLVNLNAADGAGGPVSAQVELADGMVDAVVKADGAILIRRDDATAAVTLDITAKGPLASPAIKGTVNIDRAEIRLVQATPPGVADLGEVRIKGQEPKPEPENAGADIALEIDVTGPQDIFVRGRGLDSEWAIDLEVRGTAADPRITGLIGKRRGVLVFLGKNFDLERGTVRFIGAKGIDPVLDVQLMHENDGVVGGIAVTGTGQEPAINFVSRPGMPEEEVLPRVLFGGSKQSLSPLDALSLATGVATLLDGSGGAVDDVRGAVGIDVLRFENDEGGPSVTVGKNVTDGVFVGAKQPVGGGSASVQVEIEVFDNITIDSEVGPDEGTSIGLNWKKDF